MYEEIKTAALYVRYSSTSQTEQSIEGQTRVCTEFCKNHNIQIVNIYADRATSASKDIEKRTEFLQMIQDSEKHMFDAVVVYKLDRFSRSRYDMATYKFKLKKNGVQLISATENISNDPEGIILESVLEGMAEFYSAELSQKIHRGFRESALKNQYIGGTVPLGYKIVDKRYEIDEETAPIIREAFQRFNAGETIAAICRDFNARGLRTVKGVRFGKSSFAKIFRNEKYIGTFSYQDYKAENVIPAIIDMETWDKTQAKLKDMKMPGTYKVKHTYLLSGKIYCGKCGSRMAPSTTGNQDRKYGYYLCIGKKTLRIDCDMKNVRQEFIEPLVLQDAYNLLTDANIELIAETAVRESEHELERTTNIPAYEKRLREINTSLGNITVAIESGVVPETLLKRMVELEKEKRIAENELKKEKRYLPAHIDKEHIVFWLESLKAGDINDPAFQKQLIDLFVNRVTVWDATDDPGSFTVTITYNLTDIPARTLTNFEFIPPTSRLEIKSEMIISTVTMKYWQGKFQNSALTTMPSKPLCWRSDN